MEGTRLLPWQRLHAGAVAALDVNPSTREVPSMSQALNKS
jgi:hypothetical protein